jgi:EAL domain-containing protein (putative c-di-GMP-specific phosphodiesterase class I)
MRSINQIGPDLGAGTAAESVEDAETLAIVREFGIERAQGHAIGPVPPPDRMV